MTAPRIGPYEVVRELGRGGMGVVLEVRHPDLPGRRLALKLISKEAGADAALVRFSREARLLAQVKHPNVVSIHTFADADDGRAYLVTDLVEGTNLKSLARSARFDPARAARILRALCGAVSALHAAGILHRDLKPENVILQPDDTPVLLDFGLARELDAQRLTQTGTVLGTPAYMSPEQAGGDARETIDGRCDVYGLGAILFELLAGRPPFDGTAIQIVTAVLRKDPRWPSEDRGDVPADLEAVLRKAMAKDAAARYASAAELGKDLARFAGGERVAAPRPTSGSGRVVGLATAVVVVVVGFGLAAGWRLGREEVVEAPGGPVVSSGRPTRPATPRAPTTPPPPWDPATPIASYRAQSSWLADSKNDGSPDRGRPLDSLKIHRSKALRRIDLPESAKGDVFVRFLSDARLAVMLEDKHVRVLHLDGDERVLRWTLLPGVDGVDRAFDLVVTGSTVVFSGVRAVYRAQLDEPSPADGPQELAPFVTFDASEALPDTPQGAVDTVAISPDGRTGVVAGQFSRAILFNLMTDPPTELRRFGDFKVRVRACAFSRDGERIVFGSEQVGLGATLELWTKDGLRLVERGGVFGAVKSIAFSPDGSHYLIGTDHVRSYRVDGLDALTTKPLVGLGDTPLLAFAPAPQRRLYGVMGADASKVMVWRTDSEALIEHRQVPREGSDPMDSIAVSPDGAILALSGRVNNVATIELYGVGD